MSWGGKSKYAHSPRFRVWLTWHRDQDVTESSVTRELSWQAWFSIPAPTCASHSPMVCIHSPANQGLPARQTPRARRRPSRRASRPGARARSRRAARRPRASCPSAPRAPRPTRPAPAPRRPQARLLPDHACHLTCAVRHCRMHRASVSACAALATAHRSHARAAQHGIWLTRQSRSLCRPAPQRNALHERGWRKPCRAHSGRAGLASACA